MAMPSHLLTLALMVAALLGLLIGWGQIAALWLHMRGARAAPVSRPPVSIAAA